MGFKLDVKQGLLHPQEAYEKFIESADNKDQAASSRTGKWLLSKAALTQYNRAKNGNSNNSNDSKVNTHWVNRV